MISAYKELTKIIEGRRSVYPADYTDKKLDRQTIEQILESANYAPTHKLTEPWRFTVIKNRGLVKLGVELGRLYKIMVGEEKFLQKKFDSFLEKAEQSACIIAINMRLSGKIPEWEELAAVSCAVQNMALTAESLNVVPTGARRHC